MKIFFLKGFITKKREGRQNCLPPRFFFDKLQTLDTYENIASLITFSTLSSVIITKSKNNLLIRYHFYCEFVVQNVLQKLVSVRCGVFASHPPTFSCPFTSVKCQYHCTDPMPIKVFRVAVLLPFLTY